MIDINLIPNEMRKKNNKILILHIQMNFVGSFFIFGIVYPFKFSEKFMISMNYSSLFEMIGLCSL